MELIDIKKIVRDLVQEELARLGVSKKVVAGWVVGRWPRPLETSPLRGAR